jgi:glucose/arabinose dehydrogenase
VNRSPNFVLAAVLAVLGAALSAIPGAAVSACETSACNSTGCGTFGNYFSLLVDAGSQLPAGDQIPVAFVDPGDSSPRRFVATKRGRIYVWNGATGNVLATPFLDLSSRVLYSNPQGEQGFLAMAVAPDYATSGAFYVYYVGVGAAPGNDGDIVLERYYRSMADPNVADPNGERILVISHTDASNHNGGWLAFGADGMLYVSSGDGGGACDSTGPNSQNIDSLKGKLLRLDVTGQPGSTAPECDALGGYEVPLGNPFQGATPGCGEIWAYGLRNPYRFSVDRTTGDIWIGDVGQSSWEEVNFLRSDYQPTSSAEVMNYGWKCREGCETLTCGTNGCPGFLVGGVSTCQYPNDVDPGAGTTYYWDPVFCHSNGPWFASMGGYRYRGSFLPSLSGTYLYGDAYCRQIWRSTSFDPQNPAAATDSCFVWNDLTTQQQLFGFSEDHLGELYIVLYDGDLTGTVYCLHPSGGSCYWSGWGGFFEDGFETGDTSRWSSTVP